jgi:putative ABC transport system permease protein
MRIQWLLATRYLRGRLQRSALTTLAISFGVAILFGMNGLIPPMLDAFRHSMYTSAGQVDLTISSAANGTFDQSVLNQVVSTDGVSQATGYLVRTVSLPSSLGGLSNTLNSVPSVNLTGVNPTDAENIHVYSMVTGRFLTSTDTDAIVVSEALATNLKLKVGDAWELPSASGTASFTIVGIMNITSPTAVNQVITPLVTAQKVLGADGQINSIDILLKSGTNRDTVQSALAQKLGDGFKFGSVETGSEFDTTLSLGSAIMWFFGIAALIMAGFIIFNTFRTLVAERRRDLAMLRAIGAKRSSLVGMILMESLLQGLIGTAIGLIIGWLLTIGLLRLMSGFLDNFAHINIGSPIFSSPTFIASILLGVGLSVASAYFPARSTLSITPLEALRPAIGAAENRRMKNRAWIGLAFILVASASLFFKNIGITTLALVIFLVGLVMIAPALVRPVAVIFSRLFGFLIPRESGLARENLSRQPSRAAITASALMIGLALTIAVVGMVTSTRYGFMGYLDKSLGSDYIFMPTSLVLGNGNQGADPSLAQKVSQIDGVSAVTTLRLAYSQIGDASLEVIGIDPVSYPQVAGLEFTSGNPQQAYTDLANGHSIIVNGIFSSTYNVHIGDQVTLKTSQGDQVYTVAAVGMDYLNAKLATGYISQKNLQNDFNVNTDVLIEVNQAKNADKSKVMTSLQELAAGYPAFTLLNSASFKQSQEQVFSTVMIALYLLAMILTVPGLIATANTMSINVIERTREIGILRAVGATRPQIERMILAESLMLSLLGSLLGIAVGLFLSDFIIKAMVVMGFKLDFYFPASGLIVALVLGLAVGILASLAPARKAANTEIVEALRYE